MTQVINDVTHPSNSTAAPSSRFITRIIPIQATCYPSLVEIKCVAQALIDTYLLPSISSKEEEEEGATGASNDTPKKSFSISFRKRNCNHLSRDDVISTVADLLLLKDGETTTTNFEVNLSEPDYTIVIEVCRTLCCMAVVKGIKQYKNFNLMTIRDEQSQGGDE